MRKSLFYSTLQVVALLITCTLFAQPRPDTTHPATSRTGPKPYKDVITDKAKTDEGLFKVHKIEDKYFFEIPDSLLNREILVVNRISKAAAGMRSWFFWLRR